MTTWSTSPLPYPSLSRHGGPEQEAGPRAGSGRPCEPREPFNKPTARVWRPCPRLPTPRGAQSSAVTPLTVTHRVGGEGGGQEAEAGLTPTHTRTHRLPHALLSVCAEPRAGNAAPRLHPLGAGVGRRPENGEQEMTMHKRKRRVGGRRALLHGHCRIQSRALGTRTRRWRHASSLLPGGGDVGRSTRQTRPWAPRCIFGILKHTNIPASPPPAQAASEAGAQAPAAQNRGPTRGCT